MRRIDLMLLGLLLAAVAALHAHAAGDPTQGKRLVVEHQCEICHNNKTYGDAAAVYLRKDRKVTSLAKLKAQVAVCNSELNAGMFPEDEEHVVAYLNETYYKFK